MGRRSVSGGVTPKGKDRIEFVFTYDGVRYRPTIKRIPSEANLRRARLQLVGIRERIKNGTFSFAEEFPDYRYMERLPESSPASSGTSCSTVLTPAKRPVTVIDATP